MTAKHTSADERWLVLYGLYPRLVALARARGAGSDAENIVSTVLVRVWAKSELSCSSYWSYMARAVVNEMADYHRRLQRDRSLRRRIYNRPFPSAVEDQVITTIEASRLLAICRNSPVRNSDDDSTSHVWEHVERDRCQVWATYFERPISGPAGAQECETPAEMAQGAICIDVSHSIVLRGGTSETHGDHQLSILSSTLCPGVNRANSANWREANHAKHPT